ASASSPPWPARASSTSAPSPPPQASANPQFPITCAACASCASSAPARMAAKSSITWTTTTSPPCSSSGSTMSTMAEQTIGWAVQLLLPGVEAEDDACLRRLETALENQAGLSRAHIEREKHPPALCVHYDPATVSLADVQRLAERAGARIVDRYHHDLLTVEGMDCSDCVKVIEHGVSRLDGVLSVSVNYPSQLMRVEFDSQKTDRAAIARRVRGLGCDIVSPGLRNWYRANRALVFSLSAGLLLLVGWLGETLFGLPRLAAVGLYLSAYVLGGWEVTQHAWHALRERQFDTDLLMV